MPAFIPAGLLPLHVALGKAAETWFPEGWARLKGEDRELFDAVSGGDWRRARYRPGYAVGRDAYERFRPLAADGTVPCLMRTTDSVPAPIPSEAWQAQSADSLDAVLGGTARLKLVNGESVAGSILLRAADLDAVLRGEPAPSLRAASLAAAPAPPSTSARKRAGRPTNPEGDDFWIEVTRRMMAGEGQGGQAKFTATMAQWCQDSMSNAYDAETVRKKLGRLFGALGPR